MRKLISLLLLFATFSGICQSKTYYISSVSGDDNRTSAQATVSSTPWKTLGKMNNNFSLLQPGDNVALKAGETFHGTLIISKSGTAALPIVITYYGTGTAPIISGMTPLTGWSSLGSNKYETTAGVTNGLSYIDVVSRDGSLQQMGRWPNYDASNAGWLKFDSYNTAGTQITDDSLSSTFNYVGTEMVFAPERWVIVRGNITAQSLKTLTFDNVTGFDPRSRFAYFLQNAVWTLNKNNEWYYNPSTKKLTWYSSTGAPTGIEVTNITNGITATNISDILITGVHVSGYQNAGITLTGGSRNKVIGNTVDKCGYYGIFTSGTSTVIYGNSVKNCLNTGIQCGTTGTSATSTIVRRNTIDSISMFSGHCQPPVGSFSQGYAINASGTSMVVDSNDIDHAGFIGINFFRWDNIEISSNFINHYNITKDDGGAIYTLNNSATFSNMGRKIKGNLIINGVGAPYFGNSTLAKFEGIYGDLGADGMEISGNYVLGGSAGIFFNHGARDNYLHDNLIYLGNLGREGFQANHLASDPTIRNVFRKNTIWATNATQELMYLHSDERTLGEISSDSNRIMNLNTYTTPFQIDTPTVRNISFASWKSVTGNDARTTQTTFTSTDSIRVYVNSSFTPMVLDLTSQGTPYNWITPTGTVSSLTLGGRSAIILKRGTAATAVRPTATASYSAIACFGGTSTVTTTVISGGTAPFTYSINNGVSYQSSNLFAGQTAGAKSVIVKDANNLKDTASITITQPTLLVASSIKTDALCHGANGSITVSGAGGTSPYSGTGAYTVAAGSYTYTITDANGCTAQTSQTVTAPTSLSLSWSFPPIGAEGGTTTITLISTGGAGTNTYRLNAGSYQSSPIFAGQFAGNYTAYVKDANGCQTVKSFTVTQPTAVLTGMAANTVAILCNGGSTGTAVVSATGGTAPYTYSKDGVTFQGSATFTGLPAGSYTFTIKDAVLATTTTGLTITHPTALVASSGYTPIACNGESSTLTISATGGTLPYIGDDVYTVPAGGYSKTVTDANGCTSSTTGTITEPTALSITGNNYGLITTTGGITSDTIVATGGTGSKTYSMDGSSYQSSAVFTLLHAGDHTATVKDGNDCITSVDFNIPESLLAATISAGTINCNNQTTTIVVDAIGGQLPYSGTGTFTVPAGTYSYTVTDATGDTSSVGATIANPTLVTATAAVTNITTVGGTGKAVISASGGTSPYTYSLNGAAFVLGNTFTGLAAGNYSVVVKDAKGCTTPPVAFTIVSNIPASVSITTYRAGQNVYADFNTTVAGTANMRITDNGGQLIKNQNVNVPVGTSTSSMSIKSLTRNAYYTFTVTFSNKTSTLSFRK